MRALITILFLAAGLSLSAQTSRISGTVSDKLSGKPVENALISGNAGKVRFNAWTNAEGDFSFEADSTETIVYTVSIPGYHSYSDTLTGAGRINIVLESSALDLGVVEIIGSSARSFSSLPGTATLIEPKSIERVQPIGVQEALLRVPGVTAAADDGMGNSRLSIGIRGLDPRRSSRVLIMEDGIPLQPAAYTYPNMYYNPPVERISAIEVVKGSASVKYGPHNMGGIVNYITLRPRNEFGGKVEVTGGTNNYRSIFAETGGSKNEKLKPEIQLLYKSADGFRENNHFDQLNGTVKLRYAPSPTKSHYLKFNINHENSDATYTGLTEYSFRTNPRFNPKRFDNFKVFRLSFDILTTNRISENVMSTSKFYSVYFDRDWWRENDVFVKASTYTGDTIMPVAWYSEGDLIRVGNGRNNFGNLRTFYNLAYEKNFDIAHGKGKVRGNLEAGARLHWERFMDNKVIGNAPDARTGVYYTTDTAGTVTIVGSSSNYETMALAPYLMEKVRIGSRLELTGGLRAEMFEQEHIDRLNSNKYDDTTLFVLLPGGGINYAFEKGNIFAGYYHGFTPPSTSTLNIVAARGNIDLRPERSRTIELGYRTSRSWISLEAAVFSMEVKDFVAAAKGTVLENLGSIRSSGVETFASVFPRKNSNAERFLPALSITYTYLHAVVTEGSMVSSLPPAGKVVDLEGRQLPYTPDFSFTVGLSKEFKRLFVSAEVFYTDQVFTDFENLVRPENRGDMGLLPSYFLLNANAGYKINKHFAVSFSGKNLLDKVYMASRLHSNPSQPDPNISSGILPGTRRQMNITLKYFFGKN